MYVPRAIKKAYANGTRSPDGRPGGSILAEPRALRDHVTTAPPDRTVRGTEQIIYVNNSPDTLKSLVSTSCCLNIHKPGAPRGRRERRTI